LIDPWSADRLLAISVALQKSAPMHDLLAKRSTGAVLAAALLACGGPETRLPADATPVLATLASAPGAGSSRLRAGDLAGARGSYEEALAADPDRLAALNDLAVSYALEGHLDPARRLLDVVVARGSPREQQAALVNLGEIYALDGYLSIAQACFESAHGVDPTRPEPLYALALLADARGEAEPARALLREALRLDEGAAARATFAYVYPEERLHLDALLAEEAGQDARAEPLWRALAQGRFPALAAAAERRLGDR
jgi:tetratricopeptide (TPR) repeat protein